MGKRLSFGHICVGLLAIAVSPSAAAQDALFAPLPTPLSPAALETVTDVVTTVVPAKPAADLSTEVSASLGVVHESTAGRFTVALPSDPDLTTQSTPVSNGLLTWQITTARAEGRLFAVAYADLPLDTLVLGKEEIVNSLASRSLIPEIDWQVLTAAGHPVRQGEIPGREFVYTANGQFVVLRLYLANRRVYAAVATSPELEEIGQFMSSFQMDSLWRPFVNEAGGFTVRVPMAPVVTTRPINYRSHALVWQEFTIYNLMAPADAYQIAYTDLPEVSTEADAIAQIDEIAGLVLAGTEAAGFAANEAPLLLEGHTGREFIAMAGDGRSFILRFYLVDDRLYGILASSRSLENLQTFLGSFQLQ
ncbi:MAG: hypothetical protein ACFBSG_17440 [Leptolyngbyaceae cyanobacterium]